MEFSSLTDPLPTDPEVRIGTLSNGLRYYIRASKVPAKRAQLSLVVKAGSVLEDDDQVGVAGLIPRLATNGNAHFSKEEIVSLVSSLDPRRAASWGKMWYGRPGYDATSYVLQVPTDDPDVLHKALLLLEDTAHNLTFDSDEIQREHSEAVRDYDTVAKSWGGEPWAAMLRGSRYAERPFLAGSKPGQLYDAERVKAFYRDWYRPDLMAVIAVGDVDTANVEDLIKQGFGVISTPAALRERPGYSLPVTSETGFQMDISPTAGLMLYQQTSLRAVSTISDYRGDVVDALVALMLTARFDDVAKRPNSSIRGMAPGFNVPVNIGWWGSPWKREFLFQVMSVNDNRFEDALQVILTEATRAARFGFTPSELERQKRALLLKKEQEITRTEQPSGLGAFTDAFVLDQHARACEEHFTNGVPMPGPRVDAELYRRLLPGVTLDDVNAAASTLVNGRRRILVRAPQGSGMSTRDVPQLAAVVKAVNESTLSPYADVGDMESIMKASPAEDANIKARLLQRMIDGGSVGGKTVIRNDVAVAETTGWLQQFSRRPGTIAKAVEKGAWGITEWELSNNAKIVFMPTTNKDGEVLFRAYSPGGTSLATDERFAAASVADEIVRGYGGLGPLNRTELDKFLTGRNTSVSPVTFEDSTELYGYGTRDNLEILFQLIYLAFTQPNADAAALQAYIDSSEALEARRPAPSIVSDELRAAVSGNNIRAIRLPIDIRRKVNLSDALVFYKERFADASNFTFVFVGTIDAATMKPLVEQYIATLPTLHRQETWRDVGVRFPAGIVEKTIENGSAREGRVAISFAGQFENGQDQRTEIRALTTVLQARLVSALGNDSNMWPLDGVTADYSRVQPGTFQLSLNFACPPERLDGFIKAIFDNIDELRVTGPTPSEIADVKRSFTSDYRANLKRNSYLLGQIFWTYRRGEDVSTLFRLNESYDRLTASAIQYAARRYLDTANYVKVSLVPEKKRP
jgi:zinc protease